MDILDFLTQWQQAVADVLACRARCGDDPDWNYFCALQIDHERETRAAFHREMSRVIAARVASL